MTVATIDLAEGLSLPLDVVVQRTAVLGKTGRGKTYTAKRFVEQALRAGVPVAVIDPTDAWWGLRAGADGTAGAGQDVIVFGGRHGDLPLNEHAGKMLARLVLDGRSVVLVGKGMPKAARRRLVADFLTELYDKAAGRPVLVVIDEADEYAPQKTFGQIEVAKCLGAVDEVVRRGRGAGLGTLLISQRPAVLSKDVLEQVDVLVVHGLTGKNDLEAIDVWVGKHASDEDAAELKRSLPPLPKGTAWVWAPELGILQKVHILPISTFDSSKTPKVGEVVVEPKERKPVDLAVLGAELASYAEQVKADDPVQLRARIRELEREMATRPTTEPQVKEVPVLTDSDRALLLATGDALRTGLHPWFDSLRQLFAQLEPLLRKLDHGGHLHLLSPSTAPSPPAAPGAVAAISAAFPHTTPAPTPTAAAAPNADEVKLRAGARRMVQVLGQVAPLRVTEFQWGTLARLKTSGGTWRTYRTEIRNAGLLDENEAGITLTDAGFGFLGGRPAPMDTAELQQHYRTVLRRGAAAMMDALIAAYPGTLTDEQLAEASGNALSGGTFRAYRSELVRNGLAEADGGGLRATRVLMGGL